MTGACPGGRVIGQLVPVAIAVGEIARRKKRMEHSMLGVPPPHARIIQPAS
ncbi:MAG: hypothetical protein ABGX16_24755 [Pirellulales bacterium]